MGSIGNQGDEAPGLDNIHFENLGLENLPDFPDLDAANHPRNHNDSESRLSPEAHNLRALFVDLFSGNQSLGQWIADHIVKAIIELIRQEVRLERNPPAAEVPLQPEEVPPQPEEAPAPAPAPASVPSVEKRRLRNQVKAAFIQKTLTDKRGFAWMYAIEDGLSDYCREWVRENQPTYDEAKIQGMFNNQKSSGFRTDLVATIDRELQKSALLEELRGGAELEASLYQFDPAQTAEDHNGSRRIVGFQTNFRELLDTLVACLWYEGGDTTARETYGRDRAMMTPQAVLFVEDCLKFVVEEQHFDPSRLSKYWTNSPMANKGSDQEKRIRKREYQQRRIGLSEAGICLTEEEYKAIH